MFATALTCGFEQLWLMREQAGAPWGTTSQVIDAVNELFVKRAVPYRVDAEGEMRWHGDEKTYQTITEPALAVLADTRLSGARTEYEDALAGLRSGNEKALEDAIEESAKAVESAMKVLIDESNSDTSRLAPGFGAIHENYLSALRNERLSDKEVAETTPRC